MGWDDDDGKWAEVDTSPEARAERMREIAAMRNKILRPTYAGLAILLIIVIVVAIMR